MGKLTGIATFLQEFTKEEQPESPQVKIKYETPTEKKERIINEKKDRHLQILAEREKKWDPIIIQIQQKIHTKHYL